MHGKFKLFYLLFAVFFIVPAFTHQGAQELLLACPDCGSRFLGFSSYTAPAGATLWSDGYYGGRKSEDPPVISRCPVCGNYWWIDEYVQLGLNDAADTDHSDNGLQHPAAADMSVYRTALAIGKARNSDEEIWLRTAIWQQANHRRRWLDEPRPAEVNPFLTDAFLNNNMVQLLSLLTRKARENPREHEQISIRQAEIYRQLGNFERAAEILSDVSPSSDLQPLAQLSAAQIEQRNSKVYKIF